MNKKVVIAWASSSNMAAQGFMSLLTCREGVRVFTKNVVDGRCGDSEGKPPPFFSDITAAQHYIIGEGAGPEKPVQLSVGAARRAGLLMGENLVEFS